MDLTPHAGRGGHGQCSSLRGEGADGREGPSSEAAGGEGAAAQGQGGVSAVCPCVVRRHRSGRREGAPACAQEEGGPRGSARGRQRAEPQAGAEGAWGRGAGVRSCRGRGREGDQEEAPGPSACRGVAVSAGRCRFHHPRATWRLPPPLSGRRGSGVATPGGRAAWRFSARAPAASPGRGDRVGRRAGGWSPRGSESNEGCTAGR